MIVFKAFAVFVVLPLVAFIVGYSVPLSDATFSDCLPRAVYPTISCDYNCTAQCWLDKTSYVPCFEKCCNASVDVRIEQTVIRKEKNP